MYNPYAQSVAQISSKRCHKLHKHSHSHNNSSNSNFSSSNNLCSSWVPQCSPSCGPRPALMVLDGSKCRWDLSLLCSSKTPTTPNKHKQVISRSNSSNRTLIWIIKVCHRCSSKCSMELSIPPSFQWRSKLSPHQFKMIPTMVSLAASPNRWPFPMVLEDNLRYKPSIMMPMASRFQAINLHLDSQFSMCKTKTTSRWT